MRYNGWKNYETWAVGMYLDGKYTGSGTYDLTIETVQGALGGENDRFHVAEALKDMMAEEIEVTDGFVADIYGSAMSSVGWYELADAWIRNAKEQAV